MHASNYECMTNKQTDRHADMQACREKKEEGRGECILHVCVHA